MQRTKNRIVITVVLFTLLATLTVGGFSLVYIRDESHDKTLKYLSESAKVYGEEMNTIITQIETVTETLTKSIQGVIDPLQLDKSYYFYELSERIEKIAVQFDKNSFDIMSVYVRFDPLISYSTAGFFRADTNGDGVLEKQRPTNLLRYDPEDDEHVAWFYKPLKENKPIWLDPYYNANINIKMLSYVAPLEIEGQVIGVVGVDINFDSFEHIVKESPKSGTAILLNEKYQYLVHDLYNLEDTLSTVNDESLNTLKSLLETTLNGTYEYHTMEGDTIFGYSKLINDWTVIVSLTEEEAFADLNQTINLLILLNIGMISILSIIAFFVGKRLNHIVLRNSELELMVDDRTKQLSDINHELEASLTELHETQEQLITSEKLASLGELVADVAHEINTPLGSGITLNSYINRKAQEIKEDFESGQLTKTDLHNYIETMINASHSALISLQKTAGIVETFKQVSIDHSSLERRTINLKKYTNMIIMNLKPKLKEYNHKVTITCHEQIQAETYPGIISQIIVNLVLNSIEHGFKNITAGLIDILILKDATYISIHYKDNGIGISEDAQEKIFNPFYSSNRNKGSVGLGLYILHNLITQNLKGTIQLNQNTTKGVHFIIKFPIN